MENGGAAPQQLGPYGASAPMVIPPNAFPEALVEGTPCGEVCPHNFPLPAANSCTPSASSSQPGARRADPEQLRALVLDARLTDPAIDRHERRARMLTVAGLANLSEDTVRRAVKRVLAGLPPRDGRSDKGTFRRPLPPEVTQRLSELQRSHPGETVHGYAKMLSVEFGDGSVSSAFYKRLIRFTQATNASAPRTKPAPLPEWSGAHLRALQTTAHVSDKRIAAALDIGPGEWRRIVAGEHWPSVVRLPQLAAVLRTPLDGLFCAPQTQFGEVVHGGQEGN